MPKTDLEISRAAQLRPISHVAARACIDPATLIPYGHNKAKVDDSAYRSLPRKARLVLVTAINPTPAGEGKTTVSIGLTDALQRLGKQSMAVLREPSLGPVFGVKGGATGGGYAQVAPMEDINLHFTGDLHAIGAANNLLAAMIDNHIKQGNALGIDPRSITWRRCMDMNDRQLRHIISGLGESNGSMAREDGFDITAASEVMATFCLARDLEDLKRRFAGMQVARTYQGGVVTAGDLKAEGALCVLLRDALMPNLVQTLEGTPVLIHGGPFANIAHGCNSVIATELGLRLSDIVVTEAGFGADLGCEKFIDIKCRTMGVQPDCVVIVATVRALKYHGGCAPDALSAENVDALLKGLPNLLRHIENVTNVWGLPAVVAVNRFPTDTQSELDALAEACAQAGARSALCEVWAKGGAGGETLATQVLEVMDSGKAALRFTYPDEMPLTKKIEAVATRVYGAGSVRFEPGVRGALKKMESEGARGAPVCIAKTQYSFTDNPKKLGAPEGFELTIRSVKRSSGAGFVVAFAGDIIAMPGLPAQPAAIQMDVDAQGHIAGLF